MEPLKISDELIAELQNVIVKHDERAKDGGVAIQYYAAIIGFVLAQQEYPMDQKKEFLNHLFGFANHVFEDNSKSSQPPPGEAMGKWKPGDP
ncbi:hypothetical protein [Kaarinaea lacus]